MDGKDLRKLGRKQLLEILLAQVKRIESLEQELEKKNNTLSSMKLNIKESGSIAEASLKLSGIFEAAQKACEDYQKNIETSLAEQEKEAKKETMKLRKEKLKEVENKFKKEEKKYQDRISKLEEEIKSLKEKLENKPKTNTSKKRSTVSKKSKRKGK